MTIFKNIKDVNYKSGDFYVYLLLDPLSPPFSKGGLRLPHKPFYLGKGKNNRVHDHVRESKIDNFPKANKHKISTIRKILNADLMPIIMISETLFSNSADALALEKQIGDIIGYRFDSSGPLTNLIKTGTVNPILYRDTNGFYNKKHSAETLKKISEKSKIWHSTLTDERRAELNLKRSQKLKGRQISQKSIEKMLITKYGNDYFEKQIKDAEERKLKAKLRKENHEKRIAAKRQNGWAHLGEEERKKYWDERLKGKNNPMYGRGELLIGSKNGMAKIFVISVLKNKFIVQGKLKQFKRAFKEYFNCPDPMASHKTKSCFNINVEVVEDTAHLTNGIYFDGIESFNIFERTHYESFKNRRNRK